MATSLSRYLDHLPALFSDDKDQPFRLGRFLLAFERILSGLADADPANLPSVPIALEQVLDLIDTYFDPLGDPGDPRRRPGETTPPRAPAEFLPWLATWVATELRDDWDDATRRGFIANVVPLYRRRGTRTALKTLLELYTGTTVDVLEAPADPSEPPFPPRYFQVVFTVSVRDPTLLAQKAAIAMSIIDREKPAHTYYGLRIAYPSLELTDEPKYDDNHLPITGVFVGRTTVLGSITFKP